MANKFRAIIPLVQHTPIIHFQHKETEASLRATEVKPKVDKFITNLLVHVDPGLFRKHKDTIDKYFSNELGQVAGQYKMHIRSQRQKSYLVPAGLSRANNEYLRDNNINFLGGSQPYFADAKPIKDGIDQRIGRIEDFKDVRLGLMLKDIELEIFSFHKGVVSLVEECLPYVFAIENFGTRQSKGYGSFSCKGVKEKRNKCLINHPEIVAVYRLDTGRGEVNGTRVLGQINKKYQRIKAGINHNEYHKSLLWRYLCSDEHAGVKWEKRKIKAELNRNYRTIFDGLAYKRENVRLHRVIDRPEDQFTYLYIRALLGIAENTEFKLRGSRLINSLKIKIVDQLARSEDRSLRKLAVQRFRSPIQFKVYNDAVYLFAYKIPESLIYYGEEKHRRKFDFILTTKPPLNQLNLPAPISEAEQVIASLEIPSDFNIEDFLDRTLNEENRLGYDDELHLEGFTQIWSKA